MATSQNKTLVGPPGIHDPSLLPSVFSATCTVQSSYTGSDYSDTDPISTEPVKGLTRYRSPTFESTGNPCLDFFFHVVPDSPTGTVRARLTAAWNHDPLQTLRLVCNLRGVRGTGKSDREGFYTSALWLHENHPKTLALNLPTFVQFGYLKDLLEILFRILNGFDCRKNEKWNPVIGSKEERDKEVLRKRKRAEDACRVLSRYGSDEQYKFLHDRIAELFSDLLSSDLNHLKSGDLKQIGLAAKWCPSLDSSFDRATLLCESIARRMFPRNADLQYESLSEEHYTYRVRCRLRKEVLTPLRKALDLPEVHMTCGKWDSIQYSRIASLAMKRYKEAFMKYDHERANEFINKAKVPCGALLPHEILKNAFKGEEDELAEVQWAQLVAELAKQGKFKSCIAVCSVASLGGKQKEVSSALGLLISELSEIPWKGRVMTFAESQKWHKIDGDSLKEKTKFVRLTETGVLGFEPNLEAVFAEILHVAKDGNLDPTKMVKRVFVFSDMEFYGLMREDRGLTDYEAIRERFGESGFEMPEIIFWNLSNSRSTPVLEREKGVALLSGYSKNLLKLFLEMDGEISPDAIMNAAISGDEYQNLEVFD
ncbi:hypothetical protein LUZ60_003927 [Juncus effusus]|nr:hypothetical protein LUZ60_003927 [Juncus effusus]